VKWAVDPPLTLPVVNDPESAVRVWVTPSSFLTVTVAPGFTEIELGLKAKFFMTIVVPEADCPLDVVLECAVEGPEEHAASVDAATKSSGMTTQRPIDDRSPVALWVVMILCCALCIAGSSEPRVGQDDESGELSCGGEVGIRTVDLLMSRHALRPSW
jgi:alkylhydroperoxidase family enzyme